MSALSDREDLNQELGVPPAARAIIAHALETFGSEVKARMWLERPNALLSGSSPIQILLSDPIRYELVEDELTRIDYGVYI